MLGMKTYSREYIDVCRARIDADLEAYRSQAEHAPSGYFERRFFNAQLLLLDYAFVHRLSGLEGKDGNPLVEVRVLCNSLLYNGGKLQVAKLPGWPSSAVAGLTLSPETSVLKLHPGDEIGLTETDFVALAQAFFAELEERYAPAPKGVETVRPPPRSRRHGR